MGGIWHRASNLNVQFRSPILSFEIACFMINIYLLFQVVQDDKRRICEAARTLNCDKK